MERFGITFEDLKSGSVPPISNIPNGLVLALFEVWSCEIQERIEKWGIGCRKFMVNL